MHPPHRLKRATKYSVTIGAAALAVAIASPLHAQTAVKGQDESSLAPDTTEPQSDDIVVTATKRSESLQRVPLSITAVSGDTLRERGINSPLDLGQLSPNLKIKTEFGAAPLIFMRGIGTDNYYATSANAIGIYTDGVFQGPNFAQGLGIFDLERTEILRGPQGTLFGRNTTGGLVNFVTVKPKIGQQAEGYLELNGGNFALKSIDGAMGFSLGEAIAVRLSGHLTHDDGYERNVEPRYGGDVGARRLAGLRAQILWEPTDGLEFLATGHVGFNFGQSLTPKPGFYGCPSGAIVGGFQQGCVDIFGHGQGDVPGFYDTQIVSENYDRGRVYGFTFQTTLGVTDAIDLISLSSWDKARVRRVFDADGSPLRLLDGSYGGNSTFWSQEVRLVSDFDGAFNGVIGTNYYREKIASTNPLSPADSSFAGAGIFQGIHQVAKTFGVFGELTFKPVDTVTIRAGGRWTADTREDSIETFLFNSYSDRSGTAAPPEIVPAVDFTRFVTEEQARTAFLAPLIPLTSLKKTWHNLSGRFSIDWQFAPRHMIYASYATGFKGGEFNGGAVIDPEEVSLTDPEQAKTWEAGYKGSFPDGTIGLTVFTSKITNQQLLTNPPGAVFTRMSNAGTSRSSGVELETSFSPLDGLRGSLAIAYLDAHFIEFQASPTQNYAGNRLQESPRWNISGSLGYEHDLGDAAIGVSADASWNSARFFAPDNSPEMRQDAYGLVNARMFYRFGRDRRFEFSPWVKNLFDVRYLTAAFRGDTFGLNVFVPGAPRTYGVRLRMNF